MLTTKTDFMGALHRNKANKGQRKMQVVKNKAKTASPSPITSQPTTQPTIITTKTSNAQTTNGAWREADALGSNPPT